MKKERTNCIWNLKQQKMNHSISIIISSNKVSIRLMTIFLYLSRGEWKKTEIWFVGKNGINIFVVHCERSYREKFDYFPTRRFFVKQRIDCAADLIFTPHCKCVFCQNKNGVGRFLNCHWCSSANDVTLTQLEFYVMALLPSFRVL